MLNQLSLHDYNTIRGSLSSGCVQRRVPYVTVMQACYDEEPFPGNGMGLNPCVPRGTSGFCLVLYKNHLSRDCSCHYCITMRSS